MIFSIGLITGATSALIFTFAIPGVRSYSGKDVDNETIYESSRYHSEDMDNKQTDTEKKEIAIADPIMHSPEIHIELPDEES